MSLISVDELVLRNTSIKNIVSNIFDVNTDSITSVEIPTVNKVIELSCLSNTHDDVSMLDTVYLFETHNEIFDNTYNCKWVVSKLGDIFTAHEDFNKFCRTLDGKISIPSKAVFRNKPLSYYNGKITSITSATTTTSLTGNVATFTFSGSSGKVCLENYFFDKSIKLAFTQSELVKLYSGPGTFSSECLSENEVEMILFNNEVLYIPHQKHLYTNESSLEAVVLTTTTASELAACFADSYCVRYTFEEVDSVNIYTDKLNTIYVSNKFSGKLNMTGTKPLKVYYPNYNFSQNNLLTTAHVSLYVNESYTTGKTAEMTTNTNISDLWLSIDFFAGEDIESAAPGKYGNFSNLSGLECVHVPRDFLAYTDKTVAELTTLFKSLLNVNCLIGFC